jgi:hypothetical protein
LLRPLPYLPSRIRQALKVDKAASSRATAIAKALGHRRRSLCFSRRSTCRIGQRQRAVDDDVGDLAHRSSPLVAALPRPILPGPTFISSILQSALKCLEHANRHALRISGPAPLVPCGIDQRVTLVSERVHQIISVDIGELRHHLAKRKKPLPQKVIATASRAVMR